MVKNLPANRVHEFNPWFRKIPHTMGQISPRTTTTESHVALEPELCNKRSQCNEKPAYRN